MSLVFLLEFALFIKGLSLKTEKICKNKNSIKYNILKTLTFNIASNIFLKVFKLGFLNVVNIIGI